MIGILHPLGDFQAMVVYLHSPSEKDLNMRRLTRSYVVLVSLVLFVLALTGCQPVSDARAEFCQTLRDVSPSAHNELAAVTGLDLD